MTAELVPAAADWKEAHNQVGAAWHRLAAFCQEQASNVGSVGTIISVPLPGGLVADLCIMPQKPDALRQFTSPITILNHPY